MPVPPRRPLAAAVAVATVTALGAAALLTPADAQTVKSLSGGSRPGTATTARATTGAAGSDAGSTPYAGQDPSRWSDRRLAAQLVVSCVDMADLDRARRQSAAGIGGIVLLGSRPPRHLRARLTGVRRAAATPVLPFVMSDEEGGLVQRLRSVIYPLPSAETMGGWSPDRVRRTAHDYALRMHRLGVRMDLAPVADLRVPGRYIASLDRAFSGSPDAVTARARAWRLGMRSAGVVTVLKHWPGHGSAGNSHTGPARIKPFAQLKDADLLPFDRELAAGAPVVMVGHLLSAGLTRDGVPTSESRPALRYLRSTAQPGTVVLTDSLAMAAASTSLGISPVRATVRALRAGADWAMTCDAGALRAVTAVQHALASGALPRARAEASARRIVALKARWGLAPRRPAG